MTTLRPARLPTLPRSSPLSSPSRSRTQQSPSKQMKHPVQQHTPGIINLPQPRHSTSSSSVQPSPNPARHSGQHNSSSLPDDSSLTRDAGEGKRKRRGKQNRTAADPQAQLQLAPPVPVVNAETLADSRPEHLASSAATDAVSKAPRRRRGGRANRQASPPLPDNGDASSDPSSSFPSTTPPQADHDAFSLHSRSVPPAQHARQQHRPRAHYPNEPQSSGDEWEVPALPVKPKENLSWQQELLRSGSTGNGNVRGSKGSESPASRPRSRINGNGNGVASKEHSRVSSTSAPRPVLHTSLSDNAPAASSGGALNWQQTLLLQTPDLSTLHQPSPVKPVAGLAPSLTPARQRRFQQKDNITFGLGDLDLGDSDGLAMDDVFASPGRRAPHLQHQTTPRQHHHHQGSTAVTAYTTPTKAPPATSLEPRYAGPTFHNSPAPSSLPVPSFMRRRAAV